MNCIIIEINYLSFKYINRICSRIRALCFRRSVMLKPQKSGHIRAINQNPVDPSRHLVACLVPFIRKERIEP